MSCYLGYYDSLESWEEKIIVNSAIILSSRPHLAILRVRFRVGLDYLSLFSRSIIIAPQRFILRYLSMRESTLISAGRLSMSTLPLSRNAGAVPVNPWFTRAQDDVSRRDPTDGRSREISYRAVARLKITRRAWKFRAVYTITFWSPYDLPPHPFPFLLPFPISLSSLYDPRGAEWCVSLPLDELRGPLRNLSGEVLKERYI